MNPNREPIDSARIENSDPSAVHRATHFLKKAGEGSRDAIDRLFPLVYAELRRLAQSRLSQGAPGNTLQATALVHEAYMRLIDQSNVQWSDRGHFFALAGQAIRWILIDHVRRRSRVKRGGGQTRVPLEKVADLRIDIPDERILALDLAMNLLSAEHPEKAKVVELRYFAGLSTRETAKCLGVTPRTIRRYWSFAQAWLYQKMSERPAAAVDDPPPEKVG